MDWLEPMDFGQEWLESLAAHSQMSTSLADVVDGGTVSWLDVHTVSS